MRKETDGRSVWPYIVIGSAVGGAIAYFNATESGRRMRRSLTRPDELADCVEDARGFLERKARIITDKIHGVLDSAKEGLEAGRRTFLEEGQNYRAGLRTRIQGKNREVATNVHKAVDSVSRTANTFEQSVLEPVYEITALYRGIDRGLRTAFRRSRSRRPETQSSSMPGSCSITG